MLDNTFHYYQTSGLDGKTLFYETYPKRNSMMSYLVAGDTLEYQRGAYLSAASGMLSGVNTLLEVTGGACYAHTLENTVLRAIKCYYDTTRTSHGFQLYSTVFRHTDRYYGDNMWVGQQMLKSYELTGNEIYLKYAETIWNFVQTGRYNILGDGIYWCEQKKFIKNTCNNAPAAVMALELYRVTSDDTYLEAGKSRYLWVKNYLQDPEDALYFDRTNLDGTIEEGKYTYNSKQMFQAALLLCQITAEDAYLQDVRKPAKVCSNYFFDTSGTWEQPVRILKNGYAWFAAVMLRGFLEFYRTDGDPVYINDYKTTLERLWKDGRDAKGLFEHRLAEAPSMASTTKGCSPRWHS